MRAKGRIVSYAVNQKFISIRVEIAGTGFLEELQNCKGRTKTVRFDRFWIYASVDSINIDKNLSFLLHASRKDFINNRLFALSAKEGIDIAISTDFEDKLVYFLESAATKRGAKPSGLLFELSSFKKKGDGGRIVAGKKSVFDLSESQAKVILDKLTAMLQEGHRV